MADAREERRRLLRLATAAASMAWLPLGACSPLRTTESPFRLGVASGSPEPGSVVLWTRLLRDEPLRMPVAVRWEVAHDDRFSQVVASGTAQALPTLGHSVHVEAGGLAPDRVYHYRFIAGDWASPVGRTRTLPAPDAAVQRLRLAYASCQRWEHGYYAAWRHMRADEPDFVLFLGDYIYEYPLAVPAVRMGPGSWPTTLEGYRDRYAFYRGDAALQAMHAACPWFVTWDDHEVQNDYAGERAGRAGPDVADFGARRAAAYQAFYEHMPLRGSVFARALAGAAGGGPLRVHSHQRFGRLAALNLLDTRQHKDPQACTSGGRNGAGTIDPRACAAWADPRRTMLGAQQEAWLDARLGDARGGWNIVAQSTLFGQRDNLRGPGQSFFNDGWDGYPAARGRILQALQKHRVADTVFFGGDVHENWVGHVKADYERPDSPALGVEFCGTSISSRSGSASRVAERLAENPHFVFAEGEKRGYGIADFTPSSLQVSLRAVNDVAREDSGISTLARFAVAAGRSVVEKA
jgi:alkaline phosphatase D